MRPGRELDALVAERVMGDKWDGEKWLLANYRKFQYEPPRYSTDIAAAWEVVIHLKRWRFSLTWEYDFGGGGEPSKAFATAIFDPVLSDTRERQLVRAETAPLAISLAALKAVGND